jgi:hypothetical protein
MRYTCIWILEIMIKAWQIRPWPYPTILNNSHGLNTRWTGAISIGVSHGHWPWNATYFHPTLPHYRTLELFAIVELESNVDTCLIERPPSVENWSFLVCRPSFIPSSMHCPSHSTGRANVTPDSRRTNLSRMLFTTILHHARRRRLYVYLYIKKWITAWMGALNRGNTWSIVKHSHALREAWQVTSGCTRWTQVCTPVLLTVDCRNYWQ